MINTSFLSNIECFHKKTTDCFTGENPPYHRHENTYEFYIYIKGDILMYIEDHCFLLQPGSIILIQPGELHRSIVLNEAPYERIGLNISEDELKNLSTANTDFSKILLSLTEKNQRLLKPSSQVFSQLVADIDCYLQYQEQKAFGNDILATTKLLHFLVTTSQLYHSQKSVTLQNFMPEIIIKTMRYIEENYQSEITLEELSVALNYSKNHLSKQFKHHTGLTLREYILDKKIEVAKQLLTQNISVSDCCDQAGFNDYANFIRSFKNKTGISPGKYKKGSCHTND